MRPTITLIITFIHIVQGYASHYNPYIMEEVIGNRIVPGRTWKDLSLPLPITDGYIAVPHCDDIGDIWWLRPRGQEEWESFLVVDCASPIDKVVDMSVQDWMQERRILAEVDYKTAKRWDTVGEWLPIDRREYGYIAWYRMQAWQIPLGPLQGNIRRYR